MRRQIAVTCVVSTVVSCLVTTVALLLILPASTFAQATALPAESVSVVTTDGDPRATMGLLPWGAGMLRILGSDGLPRLQLSPGGPPFAPNPRNAGVDVLYPDGETIARMGTGLDSNGTFLLRDRQGQN